MLFAGQWILVEFLDCRFLGFVWNEFLPNKSLKKFSSKFLHLQSKPLNINPTSKICNGR
jgi:hypothetical protein